MVKYIIMEDGQYDVEKVVSSINNYILLNEDFNLKNNLSSLNMDDELKKLLTSLTIANNNYNLNPYVDVVSEGRLRGIKKIIKRIIRKSILWYNKIICSRQTEINARFVQILNQQIIINKMIISENQQLKDIIYKLNVKMDKKGE